MSKQAFGETYPRLSKFLIAWLGDGENPVESIAEFRDSPQEMEERDAIVSEGYRLLQTGSDDEMEAMRLWANRRFSDYEEARSWLSGVLAALEK
jgi:hypothetical protein